MSSSKALQVFQAFKESKIGFRELKDFTVDEPSYGDSDSRTLEVINWFNTQFGFHDEYDSDVNAAQSCFREELLDRVLIFLQGEVPGPWKP